MFEPLYIYSVGQKEARKVQNKKSKSYALPAPQCMDLWRHATETKFAPSLCRKLRLAFVMEHMPPWPWPPYHKHIRHGSNCAVKDCCCPRLYRHSWMRVCHLGAVDLVIHADKVQEQPCRCLDLSRSSSSYHASFASLAPIQRHEICFSITETDCTTRFMEDRKETYGPARFWCAPLR